MKRPFEFIKSLFFFTNLLFWVGGIGMLRAQIPYIFPINTPYQVSTSVIYDMLADHYGQIWLGTNQGLYRFDGKQAYKIPFAETRQNDITRLTEDSQKKLWCMNFAKQIFYLERDTLRLFQPLENMKLEGTMIGFCFTENYIWITTPTILVAFDYKTLQLKKKITTLAIFELIGWKNKCWASTYDGELQGLDEKGNITIIKTNIEQENKLNVNEKFLFVAQRRQNERLVGQIEAENLQKWTALPPIQLSRKFLLYHILTTDENEYWICTQQGAFRWNPFTGETNPLLLNKQVTDIIKDYQGNYWISTLNEGLWCIPSLNIVSFRPPNDSEDNTFFKENDNLFGMQLHNQDMWLSTDEGNLYKMNLSNPNDWQFVDKIDNTGVRRIAIDAQYKKILAGSKIIDYENLQDKRSNIIAKEIALLNYQGKRYALYAHSFGADWIALYNTEEDIAETFLSFPINRQRHTVHKMPAYSIKSGRAYTVCIDSLRQKYWIGYEDALIEYDFEGKQTSLTDQNKKNINAQSLAIDQKGRLYVGSFSNGVFVFENQKVVKHISDKNLLKSNQIRKVTYKYEKVWIATDTEIGYLDPQNETYTDILANNGLSGNLKFQDFQPTPKGIWVALKKEILFIPLQTAKNNPIALRMLPIGFSGVQTKNNEWSEEVSFNIRTIHYKNPAEVEIYYRLLPLETQWRSEKTTQTQVRYQYLPAGEYTFESYTIDKTTGLKSIKQSIVFNIPQRFWETYWFLISISLLIVLGTWLILRYQISRYINKQRLTEQLLRSQLKALQAQMNPHFLYNMLNTVQGLVYTNQKREAGELLGDFSDLIRSTLQASEKEDISLEQEIENLQRYLHLEKARFGDDFQYQIIYNEQSQLLHQEIPSMLIQPFVENALKHALLHKQGNKKLNIHFEIKPQTISIQIEDNGIGRKKSQEIQQRNTLKSTGFGNSAIKKRIEILNQMKKYNISLHIEDLYDTNQIPLGTKVLLEIRNNR